MDNNVFYFYFLGKKICRPTTQGNDSKVGGEHIRGYICQPPIVKEKLSVYQ